MRGFVVSASNDTRQGQRIRNGKKGNNYVEYPCFKIVQTPEALRALAEYDHCTAVLNDTYNRKDENFNYADVMIMDMDNGHSDNPEDWITPERLAEGALKEVEFYTCTSRNNMRTKKDISPRPRFHVYMPVMRHINSVEDCRLFKARLLALVPEFDGGAKDAARLMYSSIEPGLSREEEEKQRAAIEVKIFHDGGKCIDEIPLPEPIKPHREKATHTRTTAEERTATAEKPASRRRKKRDSELPDVIPIGQRHPTLINCAWEYLNKYPFQQARAKYELLVARCEGADECTEHIEKIWQDAVKWTRDNHMLFSDKQVKQLSPASIEKVLENLDISIRLNNVNHKIQVLGYDNHTDRGDNEEKKRFFAMMPDSYRRVTEYPKDDRDFEVLIQTLIPYLREMNYKFSPDYLRETLTSIAWDNQFNPFIEEVKKRLGKNASPHIKKLQSILHCDNEDFVYLQKWLYQAMAMFENNRADINNEFVLVLQGGQGLGKTQFFRKLAVTNDYFTEAAVIDMKNKDHLIHATSSLICELGELDTTLKKEQSALKGFITATSDKIRLPYARRESTIPRRTVFCATVNPDKFLRDETGSRRFVTIRVKDIDVETLNSLSTEWLFEMWAEVYTEYVIFGKRDQSLWRLSREEIQHNEERNEAVYIPLPAEQEILEGLDWSETYQSPDDEGVTIWKMRTALDIQKLLDLKADARAIGRALTRIIKRDPRIVKRRNKYTTMYYLPGKIKEFENRKDYLPLIDEEIVLSKNT